MVRKLFTCILIFVVAISNQINATNPGDPKPKLIVGIVVDQMRYDYLTRYWNKFGEGGFKKLVNEGLNCSNTHFNYVPTLTGPGHASIYTGTTPAVHGIIGNNWYFRKKGKRTYCTDDDNVAGVGTSGPAGKMSPVNMITTTISDELRIASNMRSKVIGIALKDRGSILPAGHSANGAYWYEGTTGNWVTSSWYMKTLPEWVNDYNNKKRAEAIMKEPWVTLLPINQYAESTADDTPYESKYKNEIKPTFPHEFHKNDPGNLEILKYCPAGDVITKEIALAALKAEGLGKDEFTDILAISFSAPDNVGHEFGTHAIETQDTYLRLDREIAELIKEVETFAGKENVLFFLTADHAAMPNPLFLKDQKIPAGLFNITAVKDSINRYMQNKYGAQKWVLHVEDDNVYFDHDLLRNNNLSLIDVSEDLAGYLMKFEGVANTLTANDLRLNDYNWGVRSLVQKGFHPKRSGDVLIILEPGLLEYKSTGSDHSSGYNYDTHVPLIFYGWKIKNGSTSNHVNITDIAPTLSQILGIQPPNGCIGQIIPEVLK